MNPNEDDDINPGLPLAHGYKMFGNVVAKILFMQK